LNDDERALEADDCHDCGEREVCHG
jgi:hypothetical protein